MAEERRYFTVEEANRALPAVRALAERMIAHRVALAEAVEREATGVARCVEGIQELGGIVKDLDEGLVDFLARRQDEDVLLCWKLGEDEIAHWHGIEEGFAGRKPL